MFASAGAVAISIAMLVFCAPREDCGEDARGETLLHSSLEMLRFAADKRLWYVAPVVTATEAVLYSFAYLWIGPWMRDAAALDERSAGLMMLLSSAGIAAGYLFNGVIADFCSRWKCMTWERLYACTGLLFTALVAGLAFFGGKAAPLWCPVLRTTLYIRLALLRGQVTESEAKKVSVPSVLMVMVVCVIALGLGLLLSQVLHVSVDSVIKTTGAGAVAATAGLSVVEHTPLMLEQWWNVSHISNALYYYVFDGLTYFKLFPWVAPNTTAYFSHGEPVVLYERVSLMAIPLCWGLFLSLFPWRRLMQGTASEGEKSLLSVVTLGRASVLALLLVSYGTYVSAGVGVYWEVPLLLAGALAAWVLVLNLVPVPDMQNPLSPVGGVFYALACFFLLKTIFIGVVIGFAYSSGLFSGAVLWQLDPDLLLKVGFFFDSFNF